MLRSSATQWRHRSHVEMVFLRGTVILSGILSGSKSYGADTITFAYASEDDGGDPRGPTTGYNRDNFWRDEIAGFTEAIISGAPIVGGSSLEALKTMHLVYLIYCAGCAWKARFGLDGSTPSLASVSGPDC